MAKYRNVNTGEVYEPDSDETGRYESLPNWVKVTSKEEAMSEKEFAAAKADVVRENTLSSLEEVPVGFEPDDGLPGPLDVPQSGPTGSKSDQAVASVPEKVKANRAGTREKIRLNTGELTREGNASRLPEGATVGTVSEPAATS